MEAAPIFIFHTCFLLQRIFVTYFLESRGEAVINGWKYFFFTKVFQFAEYFIFRLKLRGRFKLKLYGLGIFMNLLSNHLILQEIKFLWF